MKKLGSILMVFTLLFSLVACSNNTNDGGSSSPTPQSSEASSSITEEQSSPSSTEETEISETTETGAKSLVVYFSWSGNTENVAKSIQSQTDSDIFEIVPATPYSDDYDTVVDFTQQEQRDNARPAIADSIENIADYDVIYVGFPNWLAYHKLIQCTQLA